jgi:hypothetical protein
MNLNVSSVACWSSKSAINSSWKSTGRMII